MTTITVETHIAAPLDRVFAMFTDIEHSPECVSGVRNVEFMTLGGLRLGARWRETRRVMGHDVTEEMEVTAFERNRTYTITDDSHTTRMDTTFSFEPSNSGPKCAWNFLSTRSRFPPGFCPPSVGPWPARFGTSSLVTSTI